MKTEFHNLQVSNMNSMKNEYWGCFGKITLHCHVCYDIISDSTGFQRHVLFSACFLNKYKSTFSNKRFCPASHGLRICCTFRLLKYDHVKVWKAACQLLGVQKYERFYVLHWLFQKKATLLKRNNWFMTDFTCCC